MVVMNEMIEVWNIWGIGGMMDDKCQLEKICWIALKVWIGLE